jgi:hypothetical protein
MRVFKFALICVIALVMVGCEAGEVMSPGDIMPSPLPVKPTVPLKKRPIVPTTKLPRPRIAEIQQTTNGGVMVKLTVEGEAMVTVSALNSCMSDTYIIYDGELVLSDIPAGDIEIAIEVDDEREVYIIEE